MACAGDIATQEALAATAILRQNFSDLKIRFINVVPISSRLQPDTEHPHGLSDRDFDSLFPPGTPVIFNFHAYAALIHKLTYRRHNHDNIHVRGCEEKGENINSPLELAILNQVDRFNLSIDVCSDSSPPENRRPHQGMAQGPDHRKHRLRSRKRHRQKRNHPLDLALLTSQTSAS